jgi:hypothetical protein
MMVENDGKSLVPIHACWSDVEAGIVIGFLAANEIEAVSNSKIAHAVYPITADGLGEIKIWVAAEDAEQAIALLAEQRNIDPTESAAAEKEQA